MGEKKVDGGTGRKHQAKLSGRAKDMVTRSTVMILVSDHTCRPPRRDPICIQPSLQPPALRIVSSGSKQPWHDSPPPAKSGLDPFVTLDTAAIFRNWPLQASGFQSCSKL